MIRNILRDYWVVYGGKRSVYGYRYLTVPVLLLLGMIALAARARHHGRVATVAVVLYMLGMTLIPFAIHPVSGERLPLGPWSPSHTSSRSCCGPDVQAIGWLRRVGIVLVIVVVSSLDTFSSLQAQKRLVLDHDRALASRSAADRRQFPTSTRRKTYPLEVYGPHQFDSRYQEFGSTWSASFFRMDNGNPRRIVQFMTVPRLLRFTRINKRRANPCCRAQECPYSRRGYGAVVDGTYVLHPPRRTASGRLIVHRPRKKSSPEPRLTGI